jgi:Ca2+-binding RTX toxin-like protein
MATNSTVMAADDSIYGFGGDDWLYGGLGKDHIWGNGRGSVRV